MKINAHERKAAIYIGATLGHQIDPTDEDFAKAEPSSALSAAPPRPGLVLRPSKTPGVRRWQRVGAEPEGKQRRAQADEERPTRRAAPTTSKSRPAARQEQEQAPKVKPDPKPSSEPKADRAPAPEGTGPTKGGTPSRGRAVHDEPMPDLGDLGAFNELSKEERARRAADWSVVRREIDARFGWRGYNTASALEATNDAGRHLRSLAHQGWIAEGNLELADELILGLGHQLDALDVDGAAAAHVLEDTVRKLAHQEYESIRRTLGDHGIRHLTHNVRHTTQILDKVGHEDPRERLAAMLVQINHDLGYTIPAIARGGFKVRDNFHPQASAVLWAQQLAEDEVLAEVVGSDLGARMKDWIADHSGTGVDWTDDPVGSAVRVADNTHLFADKMPEALFGRPGALEAMIKIAIAVEANLTDEALDPLKAALDHHTSDLPEPQRSAMRQAISEVSGLTPKFLASRLAGRDPSYSFDRGSRTLTVDVEQSPLRRSIGRLFGPDRADQQFHKLLSDYGVPKDQQADEVTLGGDKGRLTLRWSPPKGQPNQMEQAYQATARRVNREWRRVAALPAGRERDRARARFFGKLAKAADDIWTLEEL